MIKTAKQLTKFVVDMKRTYRLKQYITLCLLAIANPAFAQEENMSTIADIHHLAAYMVAALLIAVFVMIFSNRVYNYRLRAANIDAQRQNTQLSLVLDNSKTQIWTYHPNLHDFLLHVPQYTRQTRFIPLEVAFRHDPQKLADYQEHKDAIASLYAQAKDLREHSAGLDSDALDRALKDLDKQIEQKSIEKGFYCGRVCPEHARAMNFKCRTGDDVKAVEVDPFEWWKCNGFFAARRSPYSCGELMYRAAFSGGYIKICFGNRKTFFCPPQDVPHGRGHRGYEVV